ncbi:MAG: prepilin-type N-terminal cleavage/methylation domain-containing protein [Candidatus Eremiobacteraeota bacterium]|nr:prepilin-type N-terminal cleavage/methylation domain-containing protein [Candidatus Eremiobacteraeota bacterium]
MAAKRGFSIIELMVAVFILSTCLLLIIGIFTFLFNSVQKGVDLTTGMAIGEMALNKYLWNNYGNVSSAGEVNQTETINKMPFYYNIRSEPVDADSRLLRVSCRIYWWEKGARSNTGAGEFYAQGYGMFAADIVRYVYED